MGDMSRHGLRLTGGAATDAPTQTGRNRNLGYNYLGSMISPSMGEPPGCGLA
ncbi:hypothetical protein Raf01_20940 [Rugosimonospora africana]|uniref:Uncharacterized protein n=1 Tax=Rugosimonospora africana TaxID=556532 RepID=A0A8J3QPL8_9ACTN|nr:hypothetical protein Raf01_20940 [Rugosimonospora africana]